MCATRHVRLVGVMVGGALLVTACGVSPLVGSGSYGPLAVTASGKGGHDAHLGTGRLQITDECVTLENKDVLLVWRADRVRWDQESRTILFQTVGGETLSLQDGDTIALGGHEAISEAREEPGGIDEGGIPERDWVNPPAQDCRTGRQAVVFSVRLPADPPSARPREATPVPDPEPGASD